MDFGIVGVAAITVICLMVGQAIKETPIDNKWIPTAVAVVGGLLGIVGMLTVSGFPASDPLTAVAVGIVSGLASTGSNQLVNQLKNKEDDKK